MDVAAQWYEFCGETMVIPTESLQHAGWQQRYTWVEDGQPTWSNWQFCDDRTAGILRGREDYELREVFALQTVSDKPYTPAFETPEELARWCADHPWGMEVDEPVSYETWLRFITGLGWAPSMMGTSGNNDAYPNWRESLISRDPYAELREAAKDPTKQIRLIGGNWRDNNQWNFSCPVENYEIRDKPKVVTAYRRLYKTGAGAAYVVAATKSDLSSLEIPWLGEIEEFTYEVPAK